MYKQRSTHMRNHSLEEELEVEKTVSFQERADPREEETTPVMDNIEECESLSIFGGAGPRIGCARDYPSELQFQALEQVNLSPRCGSVSRLCFSSSSQTQTPQMSLLWRGMSSPGDITDS
ncbi:calmodulin-binding family protein [Raphanus sativus]|nr:calmodulin-binding family protein [Raphanus sativus]